MAHFLAAKPGPNAEPMSAFERRGPFRVFAPFVACALLVSAVLWLVRGERPSLHAHPLLDECRDYHDPTRAWRRATFWLQIEESAAGGAHREKDLVFDNWKGDLHVKITEGDERVTVSFKEGNFSAVVNGRHAITDEEAALYHVTPPEMERVKNTNAFIYGLPMNLFDSGVVVQDAAWNTRVHGRAAIALRIGFTPEVGSDAWILYLDPATCAMVGYAVCPADNGRPSEITLVAGEVSVNNLRFPEERRVYAYPNWCFLRAEKILQAKSLGN